MRNLLDIWRPSSTNPWRELNALQRRMDRFFDEVPSFTSAFSTAEFRKDIDFVPACDFEETDNAYLVSLDVPGMTKDQLQVELSGNTLTISGEQKEEKTEGKGAQRCVERYHGRFERTFTLPQASETDKVEAHYKDGVLRIAVPKAVSTKARKIQIGEGKSGLLGKFEKKEQKPTEKAA